MVLISWLYVDKTNLHCLVLYSTVTVTVTRLGVGGGGGYVELPERSTIYETDILVRKWLIY